MRRSRLPIAVFIGALTGCALAYWILWFTNARDYPLDVGGRPLNSIPADIPIMFETTVLFGSMTAFLAVLLLSRMPRLFHPIMTVEGHESITLDRFWLGIAAESARRRQCLRDRACSHGRAGRARGSHDGGGVVIARAVLATAYVACLTSCDESRRRGTSRGGRSSE